MNDLIVPGRGAQSLPSLVQDADFFSRYEAQTQGGDAGLGNILAAIWRHRIVCVLTFVLFCAGAAAIVFTLKQTYQSDALLMIDPRQTHVTNLQSIQDSPTGLSDLNFVRSEIQIMESDELARKVVVQLDLQHSPEFADHPSPIRAVIGTLLTWVGFPPKVPPPLTEAQAIEETVQKYKGKFVAYNDGKSFTIATSFTASDPKLAQKILTVHLKQYLDDQRDAKQQVINKAEAWFKQQLGEMSDKLLRDESEQQEFRRKNHLMRAGGETIPGRQLTGLTANLADARADLARKQARYDELRTLASSRGAAAVDSDPTVLASPLIEKLREQEASAAAQLAQLEERFGARHPQVLSARAALGDVQGKIGREIGRMTALAANDLAISQANLQRLQRSVSGLEQDLGSTTDAELTASQLEREIDAERRLYDDLLARSKQVAIQREMQEPDARVASNASLPLKPQFPQHGLLMAISVSAAALLAGAVALLVDKLSAKPSLSLEEIETTCGMPGLAVLPRIKLSHRKLRYALSPLSYLAASYQTLRNSIWFRCGTRPPKVILFTSALPGDGKTTVAAFFARSLALNGKRVLLVDTDLRRSGLGRTLRLSPRVGIVSCLRQTRTLQESVIRDPELGLDLLAVERGTADPANLLAKERFEYMLDEARRLYDVVIIDTPPIAAVDDALPIVSLADVTVMVVRWGRTPYQVIRATLRRLHLAGANVLGAALNATDPAKHRSNSRDLESYRPQSGSMFLERV
jgi:polysaccharide biosynthesis transport protein